MSRWLLSLPVLLLGTPLTVYLLATSGRTEAPPEEEPPQVVITEQGPLPSGDRMEQLAREDPVAFLEDCVRRYEREVTGFRCVMQKEERINGTLRPKEVIEVRFREKPHSVFMSWVRGAGKADRALYVEGENAGKMLARPRSALARALVGEVVKRDVDSADARQSGRYTLKEFGIKNGTLRTLAAWEAAKARGALRVEYLGVQIVPEAGDRPCYVLRRVCDPGDQDKQDPLTEATIAIDRETWLQVGSVLKGEGGTLVAAYYFRDIHLNPEFKQDDFAPSALTR